MEKLDKVIAGLECCMDDDRDCYGCPQDCDEFGGDCVRRLMLEAAEWLHSLRGEVMHLKECRSGSGDLISRRMIRKVVEVIPWYGTNDKGVLHTGAADEESAYIRYADVARAVEMAGAVEAEPVVHAHWEDEYGGKYANPRYRCSACKEKALFNMEQDMLLSWRQVQVLTERCPHCGAHMDEEVAG